MSILDKVIAAVTPPESEDARREAREKAQAAASPGDWLSMVLEHHKHIETAFAAVKAANTQFLIDEQVAREGANIDAQIGLVNHLFGQSSKA